jgi:predicted GIY-YIG superfamily endonuclease
MNDLIVNMDNHDQIIRIIGKAIHEKEYDIACETLIILNDLRMSNSLKPLSLSDVLFMNFMYLSPDDETTKDKKCLYVFKLSDGSVKIGVSKNPEQRMGTLSKQSGKEITTKWYSEPLENAFKIEKDLHRSFSKHRLEGEYFQIDFNDVLSVIKDKYDLDVSVAESIYKRHKEVTT